MSQSGAVSSIGSSPTVPTSFETDSGTAVPVLNTIEILGGSGITTSGSGNTVTITATSSGFTWTPVTSANNPVTLAKNKGYIAKGAGVVNFILPAAAAIGDTFWIKGYGNLWTLDQNAAQSVTLGIAQTTIGAFGGIIATQVQDSIEILTVSTNTEFDIITCVGNPEFI